MALTAAGASWPHLACRLPGSQGFSARSIIQSNQIMIPNSAAEGPLKAVALGHSLPEPGQLTAELACVGECQIEDVVRLAVGVDIERVLRIGRNLRRWFAGHAFVGDDDFAVVFDRYHGKLSFGGVYRPVATSFASFILGPESNVFKRTENQ